jgi:hydroxyethylthiazole kinase-like sugar kinase family protein
MTRALELGRAIKVAADYKRPLTVDAVVAPRRRIRRFTSLLVLSYQSQRGTFGSVRARTTIVRKLTEADQLVADRRVVTWPADTSSTVAALNQHKTYGP